MAAVALSMDRQLRTTPGGEPAALRKACNEFIGMTMFSGMLKQARESSLNSDLFSSPGQKIFQNQLDSVLLRNASEGPVGSSPFGPIGEALYRSLSAGLDAAGDLDVTG